MKAKQRSVTDQKPNAWIVNPKDRGRKSIKSDSKVYLKDGQNFEIELYNPLKESVLTDVKVNGKSVSSSGLVLRPGERFYLDCFIDDHKKFIFKTYLVEDSDESKEAISINGIVEVFFYKEETLKLNNWKEKFVPVIERHYYPVYYPWYQPIYYPWYHQPYYYGGTITTNGGCGTTTLLNRNSMTVSSYNISNTSYTSGANQLFTGKLTSNTDNYAQNIETGRIEKGKSSSQQFTEVDIQFEKYHIASVIYQLFPESQKPVETKDISDNSVKHFCENCGNNLKGTENFCSQCGKKLKTVDVVLV